MGVEQTSAVMYNVVVYKKIEGNIFYFLFYISNKVNHIDSKKRWGRERKSAPAVYTSCTLFVKLAKLLGKAEECSAAGIAVGIRLERRSHVRRDRDDGGRLNLSPLGLLCVVRVLCTLLLRFIGTVESKHGCNAGTVLLDLFGKVALKVWQYLLRPKTDRS